MPNIKSAKKRVLVNRKKNAENRTQTSALRTAIKKFNNAIDTNNIPEAEALLPETFSVIDSCCQKGIIHRNNAANQKSALSKRLSDVKSGKLEIVIKKDNKTIAAEKAKAAQEARDAARAEFRRQADERKAKAIEAAEAKAKAAPAAKAPAAKTKAEKVAPEATEPKKLTLEEKLKIKKAPAGKLAKEDKKDAVAAEKKPAAPKAPAAKKEAGEKTVKAEKEVKEPKEEKSE